MFNAGALNRAEWLKFLGLFFNLDDSANTIFNEINSSYYRNSAMYKAATNSTTPPTVAWISRIDNETSECINSFELSYAPYKGQYTRDAGGNVTDMATVAAMPNVIESPCSANTLSFAWEVDVEGYSGGFATEADAVAGLQTFLQTESLYCVITLT